MLAYTLSCRDNWSSSGAVARIAGDAIGADAHLPNMATADFLACLSKAATERAATGLKVPVQSTGKATRAAIVARIGQGRWIYPAALFSAPAEALDAQSAPEPSDTGWVLGTTGATGAGDDEDSPEDGDADNSQMPADDTPAYGWRHIHNRARPPPGRRAASARTPPAAAQGQRRGARRSLTPPVTSASGGRTCHPQGA